MKNYDHWKTTNADDEWLGNAEQGDEVAAEEAWHYRHFPPERENDFADDDAFVHYVDELEEREAEADRLEDIEP